MKTYKFRFLCFIILTIAYNQVRCQPVETKTTYLNAFENTKHEQIAYWFINPKMLIEKNWKSKIDSLAQYNKYTLIFLTSRGGVSFYNTQTVHPFFKKMVDYAHQKGLKIGLQIWKSDIGTTVENSDRLIQEGEMVLDENGKATYQVKASHARYMNLYNKSELFKIYAFRKTSEGFYDPSTLTDITNKADVVKVGETELSISLNAGTGMKGYTAYILTQHYYNSCSNYSEQALQIISDVLKSYADIPFDGIGLDEYKNLQITKPSDLKGSNDLFRERLYSIGMGKKLKEISGMDLDSTLFDMRYAPVGNPAIRIKAINEYMNVLRLGTLGVEEFMYDTSKKLFGKNTFIGLHNTFHNNLDIDEVWQTGTAWWSIKRDYGQTDENISLPTVLGVGISYPARAMYNMYYNKDLERFWKRALNDLRYGIRTHYHAINDGSQWGIALEEPKAVERFSQVENAARLLNRFNPPLPNIKLLVIYGMEVQYNWYPNYSERGVYDVNDKMELEKKSKLLWDYGYQNIAVPTDVINDGRLVVNAAGKPEINGHVFDAVVFLYPQYAKKPTLNFLQDYVGKGGKILFEGSATYDFEGNDISNLWATISTKAIATSFSVANVEKLGVVKNTLVDGVENEKGSYTFTNTESLKSDATAVFNVTYKGNIYTGTYKGLAAIKFDEKGNLQTLAATKFSKLKMNNKVLLEMSKEADVFVTVKKGKLSCSIADPTKSIKCKISKIR